MTFGEIANTYKTLEDENNILRLRLTCLYRYAEEGFNLSECAEDKFLFAKGKLEQIMKITKQHHKEIIGEEKQK